MIKNYIKIAFRNLWKQKGFSAINILGLSLGMACSLLILLWVRDEKSVDAFHQNGNNLYYIYERNHLGGKIESWYWTQGPLAEELKKEIPEIKAATPFSWPSMSTFTVGDKIVKQNGYSADSDFFSMFSYPLIEGRATDALNSPNSISISRKMAADFFGAPAAAIGKTIRYENKKDFTVKAVFEDLPSQVSTPFDYIISWTAYLEENGWAKGYGSVDPRTVIQLREGAKADVVEKKIKFILDKFDTELGKDNRIELGLQKFDQYYLHSEFKNGYPVTGRIIYVQLFSLVAIFILLIACINFMNLTTARSMKRAREIGVRKVMGALRSVLIPQFIGEAVLMATIAMTGALILASTCITGLQSTNGKTNRYSIYAIQFLDQHTRSLSDHRNLFRQLSSFLFVSLSYRYPGIERHAQVRNRGSLVPQGTGRFSIHTFHRPHHFHHSDLATNLLCTACGSWR